MSNYFRQEWFGVEEKLNTKAPKEASYIYIYIYSAN